MSIPFLDLKRQYENIKNEVEPKVLEILGSGAYIGGKYVTELEEQMKKYLGVKHVISCANGTDALVLALRAYGVKAGDEVITTAFTFFATAEAIASIGAIPVFCDVEIDSYNIDVNLIKSKITAKTKAIMPVHIFGLPANLDEIYAIADKHGLAVIEDSAQAIGSVYKGKKIGNTRGIATFSFYPTKNLGAMGDAGMLTTNDDNLATIIRAYKEHGMGKNGAIARELLTGEKDEFKEEASGDALYNPYKYFNYVIGYNSRLDGIQAGILSIKLKYIDEYNKERARVANIYNKELKNIVELPISNSDTCHHQYVIKTSKKEELAEFLSSKNIGSGAFYPVPMHMQKAFSSLGYKLGDFPIAEKLCTETVCLPIFPELTDDEAMITASAVKEFLGGK